MNVIIRRATNGWHQSGKGWRKGGVFATVDGYDVAFLERKGWDCRCDDEDCDHITAVARLIDPETLARIEAGRPRP